MGLNKTGLIVGHVWFTRHLDQVFTLVAKWIDAYAYGVTQTHALVYGYTWTNILPSLFLLTGRRNVYHACDFIQKARYVTDLETPLAPPNRRDQGRFLCDI